MTPDGLHCGRECIDLCVAMPLGHLGPTVSVMAKSDASRGGWRPTPCVTPTSQDAVCLAGRMHQSRWLAVWSAIGGDPSALITRKSGRRRLRVYAEWRSVPKRIPPPLLCPRAEIPTGLGAPPASQPRKAASRRRGGCVSFRPDVEEALPPTRTPSSASNDCLPLRSRLVYASQQHCTSSPYPVSGTDAACFCPRASTPTPATSRRMPYRRRRVDRAGASSRWPAIPPPSSIYPARGMPS